MPMTTVHAISIHPQDNVATLCEDAKQGDRIETDAGKIELLQDCRQGQKIALTDIEVGMKVIKYNAVMGTCTQAVRPGEWVHTHNLESDYMKNEGEKTAS